MPSTPRLGASGRAGTGNRCEAGTSAAACSRRTPLRRHPSAQQRRSGVRDALGARREGGGCLLRCGRLPKTRGAFRRAYQCACTVPPREVPVDTRDSATLTTENRRRSQRRSRLQKEESTTEELEDWRRSSAVNGLLLTALLSGSNSSSSSDSSASPPTPPQLLLDRPAA